MGDVEHRREMRSAPGASALVVGVLAPPVIWAIRFGVVYVLVPYVCTSGWVFSLHAITIAALAAVAVIGSRSWRTFRRAPGTGAAGDSVAGRIRFMALTGALTAAFFFLVIVAEGLANFFVDPCQQAGVPIA